MPKFIVTVDGQDYAVEAGTQPTPEEVRAHLAGTPVRSGPPSLGLTSPPQMTAPDPRGEGPSLGKSLLQTPGMGESLATLPMLLADLLPGVKMAKPFTVPIAAGLGGLGEGAEQLTTSKPFSINDIIAAGLRQGGLEGAGRTLEAGARPLMALFGVPGAKKAAVTAALEEGIGRNLGKARSVAGDLSQAVESRVAGLPDVPLDEILGGAPDVINKNVSRSILPLDTEAELRAAEAAIRGQNAPVLSATETLAKKRGAAQGFELTDKKLVQGRSVTPTSLMQEVVRSGAQGALESRDAQQRARQGIVRRMTSEPLPALNQRLGNTSELVKYLDPAQDKELGSGLGMLARMGIGAGLGGGAAQLSGQGYGDSGGAATLGALLAANPALAATAARIIRRSGEALPPLARGTSVTIQSIRRKNAP